MKTQPLKIIMLSAVLLMFAGSFVSCKEKEEYPKEISFTEYSLEGTSCQWKNLNYNESVIVINSNEELKNYIDCTESNYPEIDFSKNTLLLARGRGGDVRKLDVTFFQNAKNRYTLKITIHLGIAAVVLSWMRVILVPKISDEAIVTLKKQETYN